MHELTALELGIVVDELKERIDSSFLKKFYDLGDDSFKLVFYKGGANAMLYCRLCVTFNETEFSEEAGPATSFAMAVRKRVEGARVTQIEQYGSDRIVVINIENHGERYRLVFEMFGQGNLILLGKDDKVEVAYKILSYKDRIVKPKLKYEFPRSSFLDIHALDHAAIDRLLEDISKSDEKLIVALSRHINIGPVYLENIIKRHGLDPKGRLKEGEIEELKAGLIEFLDELKNYKPRVYEMNEGKDYSVVQLEKYKGSKSIEYATMSKLLDNIYLKERTTVEDKNRNAIDAVSANIEKQKELVKVLSEESISYRLIGNKIFEHMNEVNELISYMGKNKRVELKDLESMFPRLRIKGIDLKNKTVSITID
jgi:predicted ribosome quality control (RQC) complex YloA/Tae2 family protein